MKSLMVPLEEIILSDLPLFSQAYFTSMKNTSKKRMENIPSYVKSGKILYDRACITETSFPSTLCF